MTTKTVGEAVSPRSDLERKAERLLRSTAARAYDPDLDIDWTAPLVEDAPFIKPERSSLYGTEIWERMSEQERVTLTRHEAASVMSVGLWFEEILIRMLAKIAYEGDPTSQRVQYAFAEIAEECRHSTMFARTIQKMEVPAYGVNRLVHVLGRVLPFLARGEVVWAATLLGEEIPDRLQREMVEDPRLQPLMKMVNRIHIMEEARHIGFAREELAKEAANAPRWLRPIRRMLIAHIAFIVSRSLINPEVYRSIGLDPKATRRIALRNPHHQRTLHWSAEKVVATLDDHKLIRRGNRWWKASFLVR
ncbi:MAG TPA: diiron oxygenase [Actinospica sp.]|nr:diiron oxygenase [Actinospica sp.]